MSQSWSASANHGSPGNINGVYTEVDENNETFSPTKFSLEQNYPNPFNPSTTIKYSLSVVETRGGVSQHVTLKVYDILGREVATLVNQKQNPGNYKVTFDATNLPSGVYVYRMQSGNFTSSKKLILLR